MHCVVLRKPQKTINRKESEYGSIIKKNNSRCNVSGIGTDTSFFYRANPADWKQIIANAHSRVPVRADLWMEIWRPCRFHIASASFSFIWNACFFPSATAMAFELITYGAVSGFLYSISKWHCVRALYRCLISAMLAGRIVWGIVQYVQLGLSGGVFTWQIFLTSAFIDAIIGVILQLILIPCIMVALNRSRLKNFESIEERKIEES